MIGSVHFLVDNIVLSNPCLTIYQEIAEAATKNLAKENAKYTLSRNRLGSMDWYDDLG